MQQVINVHILQNCKINQIYTNMINYTYISTFIMNNVFLTSNFRHHKY